MPPTALAQLPGSAPRSWLPFFPASASLQSAGGSGRRPALVLPASAPSKRCRIFLSFMQFLFALKAKEPCGRERILGTTQGPRESPGESRRTQSRQTADGVPPTLGTGERPGALVRRLGGGKLCLLPQRLCPLSQASRTASPVFAPRSLGFEFSGGGRFFGLAFPGRVSPAL